MTQYAVQFSAIATTKLENSVEVPLKDGHGAGDLKDMTKLVIKNSTLTLDCAKLPGFAEKCAIKRLVGV